MTQQQPNQGQVPPGAIILPNTPGAQQMVDEQQKEFAVAARQAQFAEMVNSFIAQTELEIFKIEYERNRHADDKALMEMAHRATHAAQALGLAKGWLELKPNPEEANGRPAN